MSRTNLLLTSSLLALLSSSVVAKADTVGSTTVLGTDTVYGVGTSSAAAVGYGATSPSGITLGSGASYFTFAVSSGATVTVNFGTGSNYNDADGVGSVSGETNTGTPNLSGIVSPTAGFIAGVFVGPGGPVGTLAPAPLSFIGAGGTGFTTLVPLLNQVFFIGDGRTGDGTGAFQTFYIPTGATTLYLGLTDACAYSGIPSCYADNRGSFDVTYTEVNAPSAIPEPSSLVLLGTSALGLVGVARRRMAK